MVNWLAIFVAAIAGMVIGSLWYSPILFGKKWQALMNKKMNKENMNKSYLSIFVALVVMAFSLDFLALNIIEISIIWLGFVATIMVGSVLWEGNPKEVYFINVTHWLVVMIVMGAIVSIIN